MGDMADFTNDSMGLGHHWPNNMPSNTAVGFGSNMEWYPRMDPEVEENERRNAEINDLQNALEDQLHCSDQLTLGIVKAQSALRSRIDDTDDSN